jgi:hypothetical protein
MLKTLKLVLLFAIVSRTALWGQDSIIRLTLIGNANASQSGANYNFTLAGTGSVTGFGNARLYGTGVIDLSTIASSAPITGTFTLIFSDADALLGTFSIPSAILIPQLGDVIGTGAAKIIGGTGKFIGASGSFSGFSGSGTLTGPASTSFQISGTGTLSTPAASSPGILTYGGSIAHIAVGAGWKTTFTFVNTGATASQLHLAIFDENGGPLALSVTFPQFPSTPAAEVSTIDRTLAAGALLIIESVGGPTLLLGSAQLTTDGAVTGSAIFRYTVSGQEAVVPLETRNPTAFVLPFDNTTGLANGLAISNITSTAAAVKIVITDDSGVNNIVTDTVSLSARGHLSFVLTDKYALAAQRRGTIIIQAPSNGQISVLGIRATSAGAYTSIPPGVK